MNSKDTLSLKRNLEENTCTIRNDRTGKKVEFYMESPDLCALGISGVPFYEALFGHISDNLQTLFENTTYKDINGYNFSWEDPSFRYYQDYIQKTGNIELEAQRRDLEERDRQYRLERGAYMDAAKAVYHQKIKPNKQEIKKLEQKQATNGWKYVLSMIKNSDNDIN